MSILKFLDSFQMFFPRCFQTFTADMFYLGKGLFNLMSTSWMLEQYRGWKFDSEGINVCHQHIYELFQHCGLRKVSTLISLIMPRRLSRKTLFASCGFSVSGVIHYTSIPWDEMCWPGLACADCAGWSGSIHYTKSTMFVFSWIDSYIY